MCVQGRQRGYCISATSGREGFYLPSNPLQKGFDPPEEAHQGSTEGSSTLTFPLRKAIKFITSLRLFFKTLKRTRSPLKKLAQSSKLLIHWQPTCALNVLLWWVLHSGSPVVVSCFHTKLCLICVFKNGPLWGCVLATKWSTGHYLSGPAQFSSVL